MLEQTIGLLSNVSPLDNLSLLSGDPEWIFDPQYGWRRDIHITNDADFYKQKTALSLNVNKLRRLKKISAVFSSFFNTPSEGLGTNYIRINYSDSTYNEIGTSDNHSNPANGFRVDNGVTSYYSSVDLFNLFIEFTIPENKIVTSIGFVSNGYNNQYNITLRGFKDIVLTYR